MEPLLLFLLLLPAFSGAAQCENGWATYKDELCIKAFTTLLTFDEADEFCTGQSTEASTASLVMVKDSELQDLLGNYTHDIYNTLWLGGKYDEETTDYKWTDGDPFSFTNWQEGYPRNSTESACVELRPVNALAEDGINVDGKWADVNCQKLNLVMCQRPLSWTLQDAVEEIKKIRKEVFPVGTIYTEFYNQQSPQILWPSMTWQHVTNSYAGLFFRASGGDSESWGVTQTDCAPRIIGARYIMVERSEFPKEWSIPENGWSGYGRAGVRSESIGTRWNGEGIDFQTQGCEVRPRNQAIRVWLRIA